MTLEIALLILVMLIMALARGIKKDMMKTQPHFGPYRLLFYLIATLFATTFLSPSLRVQAAPAQPTNGAWDERFGAVGVEGEVTALALAPNGVVYAGGEFTKAGGVAARHIARWDGRSWQPLGEGIDGEVYAIAVDGDDIYVAG